MPYSKNSIVLVPIPFSDLSSQKVRPAIVIGHGSYTGDHFVIPITSQLRHTNILLQDWQSSGLNVPCGIKAQIATLHESMILQKIGDLSANDATHLDETLRAWLEIES